MARIGQPSQVSTRLPHGKGAFVEGIRRSNRDFPDDQKPQRRNYAKAPSDQLNPAQYGNSGFGGTGLLPGQS